MTHPQVAEIRAIAVNIFNNKSQIDKKFGGCGSG
jgi:hypothetical protein